MTYVYTYPFKGAYRPLSDPEQVAKTWNMASGPINLYVHVPFCDMKCSFCNLFTTTNHTSDSINDYVASVKSEAKLLATQVDWHRFGVDSLYFGGGTPALLSAKRIGDLLEEIQSIFVLRTGIELAIEAAPNSVTEIKLREIRSLGFQRISFGVQSFDEVELRTMGRYYTPALACHILDAASSDFDNVNVDLIYGIPGQTSNTWLSSLKTAVSLHPQTITLYPLTIRSRTAFGRAYELSPVNFPRRKCVHSLYDQGRAFLSSKSYAQHTMAMFARSAGGSRHEANEFAGIPTLGLGVAALSYGPTVHYTSGHYFEKMPTQEIIGDYILALRQNRLPIRCGIHLDVREMQRRRIILGLLSSGLNRTAYAEQFGETPETGFAEEFNILKEEDCLLEARESFRLSAKGTRFSGLVAELFASPVVRELARSYR